MRDVLSSMKKEKPSTYEIDTLTMWIQSNSEEQVAPLIDNLPITLGVEDIPSWHGRQVTVVDGVVDR